MPPAPHNRKKAFSRVLIDDQLRDAGWCLDDGVSVRYEYRLPDGAFAARVAVLPIVAEPPPTYTPGGQAVLPAANQPVPGDIPARLFATLTPSRACCCAEILAATGISEPDWNWAIRQLKEEGLVVQDGEKHGARYRRKGISLP